MPVLPYFQAHHWSISFWLPLSAFVENHPLAANTLEAIAPQTPVHIDRHIPWFVEHPLAP